jgi:predicted DNA-binding protein
MKKQAPARPTGWQLSIRLQAHEHAQLTALANRTGRRVTAIVREAIRNVLKNEQSGGHEKGGA